MRLPYACGGGINLITILAEKPDVGNKIAAALDGITLKSGKKSRSSG